MNLATAFVERYRYQTLYLLFLAAYLFVFMPMLFRFGYHWDETLDFDGTATDTYLANGRWMQALLRYLLGEGAHPWTTSFLACLILPYATVIQCKLYQWEDILHDVIFGCLTIVMYQYAFVMQYSHQSDVTAIGMLLMTFSAIPLTDKGWSFKTVLALITTCTALSIYQTTGLYLAAILLVWGTIQCFKGNMASTFHIGLKAFVIVVLAAAICEAGSQLAKTFVDEETRLYCALSHEKMSNTAGILEAPLGYIAHYALRTAKHCIKPEFKLEWMYGCTLAALALNRCRRIPVCQNRHRSSGGSIVDVALCANIPSWQRMAVQTAHAVGGTAGFRRAMESCPAVLTFRASPLAQRKADMRDPAFSAVNQGFRVRVRHC